MKEVLTLVYDDVIHGYPDGTFKPKGLLNVTGQCTIVLQVPEIWNPEAGRLSESGAETGGEIL